MTAAAPEPLLARPKPLRVMPIPDTEPEPDCEPFVGRRALRPAPWQPTLALALVTTPEDDPVLDLARFDRQPTATRDLPDPDAWARRMVQAVLESLAGVRPVAQLVRWTSAEVYAALQRRCARTAGAASATTGRIGPHRRAVVRSVRVCQPADGVVEACAVVVARGRVQAVALRLEGLDGRWRMTALELG